MVAQLLFLWFVSVKFCLKVKTSELSDINKKEGHISEKDKVLDVR